MDHMVSSPGENIVTDKVIKTFNTSIFDRVLVNGTVEEKKNLAKQLGHLACDSSAPELEHEAIVPALKSLASDPVKEVRLLLAKILVHCEKLHSDVVFSIIADDEDIALPFLTHTPALGRLRCLTVLKIGDKARQMILASRSNLNSEVVSFIADYCDSDVCVALLDNDAIEVSVKDYRRIYVRFREVPEVIEQLLKRSDLPLEVRILQAKKASTNVHRLMVERGWMPANDAQEIIVDAEETTMLRILASAKSSEIDSLVVFLSGKGLLTASLILRAACSGDMRMVVHTLSYLSSTPTGKVQKVIDDRAVMGLMGVYNRSGLPKEFFHIIRAAADVAGDMKQQSGGTSKVRFGPAIIECLMTRYSSISQQEKPVLLEIVARLSDEHTRNLARQLAGQLQAA